MLKERSLPTARAKGSKQRCRLGCLARLGPAGGVLMGPGTTRVRCGYLPFLTHATAEDPADTLTFCSASGIRRI